jgi:hypothetical protein
LVIEPVICPVSGATRCRCGSLRRSWRPEPREPTNHRWLHDTDRIRFVGPGYDPHNDADHAMTGDPRTWFDILVHQKIATSVNFLT